MNESDGLLAPFLAGALPWLYIDSRWWTVVGLLGNGIFSSRFIIQWLSSEKKKALHVPPIFWHLSFWGSVVQLLYAFHLDKLPILLSCAFLPFIHGRNLMLLGRGEKFEESATA
jgi:lipid-A-disaccharide synthase-like uncharacterized protein